MKNTIVQIARKKKGIGQVELSKMVGVSQAYISFIESGKKTPSKAMSEKIFKAIGVRIPHESKEKRIMRIIKRIPKSKLDAVEMVVRAAEKERV